jgi:hypothetical protein
MINVQDAGAEVHERGEREVNDTGRRETEVRERDGLNTNPVHRKGSDPQGRQAKCKKGVVIATRHSSERNGESDDIGQLETERLLETRARNGRYEKEHDTSSNTSEGQGRLLSRGGGSRSRNSTEGES